ncbi:hypothetical protein [Gluconacetobacter asukensis]|uniref:hypothetical protein n=1 Tax=Gluconacetobacter asukensis TaxID=1017181 RepID=UPI001C818FF0|nr:hypothetical protein [Gluconacetobacter asukensis]
MRQRSAPSSVLPRLPNPKKLKLGVLVVLAVAYGVLFVTLSRHPKAPPKPRYTAIPVAVVKTAPQIGAAPPAPAVQLQPVPTVEVPQPRLTIR